MGYQEDYEEATIQLQDLIAKRERLVPRILAAQRRVIALGTLLNLPNSEDQLGMEMVGTALRRGRLTDAVRRLLSESRGPLTTKGIVAELKKLGFPMEGHVNPAASVNSICNRLHEQGFAREAEIPGRKGKAWKRVTKQDQQKFEEMTPEERKTFVRTRGL